MNERRKDYQTLEGMKTDISYIKESLEKDVGKLDAHITEDQKYHRKMDRISWIILGGVLAALYTKQGLDGLIKAAFAAVGG